MRSGDAGSGDAVEASPATDSASGARHDAANGSARRSSGVPGARRPLSVDPPTHGLTPVRTILTRLWGVQGGDASDSSRWLHEDRGAAEPLAVSPARATGHDRGREHPPERVGERAAEEAADDRSSPSVSHPLGRYLSGVEAFFRRYVAFPSDHEPVAIALWVAHAHLVEQFETSPLLAVTSAEMRSGKTRTLDCLELVVPNPFRVITPSEAVVYTVLAQRPRRTMLLDEADAIFGTRMAERYEGLRAILNAGNRKGTPVLRVKLEGRRREVDEFDVFGPKAIAGIGDLPPTVTDRAIPIRLKRRAPGELVAKFRRRIAEAEARDLDFEPDGVTLVTDVTVPDELNDRAADSWEPLLAIAKAAGAGWWERAWRAATALSSEQDAAASLGMRLLADIRDVFGERDHLSTAELLEGLHNLEDAPWSDWYGKALTARGLARLLEPYRIGPHLRRLGGDRRRGYYRSDFMDVWERYAPVGGTVPSVTTVPSTTPGTGVTGVTSPGKQHEAPSWDPENANDAWAE